ncbi:MAG TPA: M28 family peptidase [Bacillota bacterium]|nr:M28 family peptidase [Bacillota bacterium]
MSSETNKRIDRDILSTLYFSNEGSKFVEELVDGYGARFGGSDEERAAADFILKRFNEMGLSRAWKQEFECLGWTRKETRLEVLSPQRIELDCIALPFCPPRYVEGRVVYLGDGDPQAYADNRDALKGAIAMVNTATPKFYHRAMHRGEKLGRAVEAGAIGFIWMRGEPGGLPETGSARFNRACEVPAISVSFETGHEMLRMARKGEVRVRIDSTNVIAPTKSYNVIGEITGVSRPEEVIVIGGHYDGHDINQSANDNGAGTAVVMEVARALAEHKELMARTIRFVAFAQEEMGLIGSDHYVQEYGSEKHMFMINTDGAGRGGKGTFALQGWSEAGAYFKKLFGEMHESHVSVGDRISLYSDMYWFAAAGVPSATYTSAEPSSSAAPRGWGHTYWDTLDKLNPRAIQLDAVFLARLVARLATMPEIPVRHKTPGDFRDKLEEMGLLEVLKYELRAIPGEDK